MLNLSALDPAWLDELAAQVQVEALDRLELALQQVGAEVIAYLRSLTTETAPPWRKGEGERFKHPGGWADRTSVLANSYSFEVLRDDQGVTLVFRNSAEYAFWVEARDGLFVLSGVTEPGGPVEKALRNVRDRLFPDWEVRTTNLQGLRVSGDATDVMVGSDVVPLVGD